MKFCDECLLLRLPQLTWSSARPMAAGEPADA
jgi:hypothetical protein